jgi:hypothetical protein
MAGAMIPPVPPPAPQHSQQLPLPLPLGPSMRPAVVPTRPPPEVVVRPQQVWPHLVPPARTRVRQAFARVLQEVLRDAAGTER